MQDHPGTPTSVLSRAMAVLSAFGADDHALELHEIVARTGLPKTTVHRLLGELTSLRLLERDDSGRHRLGGRLFELGMQASVERRLLEVAMPFLQDLYERTHATVHLGVREGIISPTFVLSRIHPSLSGGPALVHVDAYRLADADELEDLDLEQDLDASVTVVEWGRGKAEQLSASRLEITLIRDTGSTMAEQGGGPVLDFSESDDDEPRSIAIAAFGDRWKDQRPF